MAGRSEEWKRQKYLGLFESLSFTKSMYAYYEQERLAKPGAGVVIEWTSYWGRGRD